MDSENKNIAEFDYDYKKIVPPRLHRFYEIIGKEIRRSVRSIWRQSTLFKPKRKL